jgi:hypothetical protein
MTVTEQAGKTDTQSAAQRQLGLYLRLSEVLEAVDADLRWDMARTVRAAVQEGRIAALPLLSEPRLQVDYINSRGNASQVSGVEVVFQNTQATIALLGKLEQVARSEYYLRAGAKNLSLEVLEAIGEGFDFSAACAAATKRKHMRAASKSRRTRT